MKITYSDIEDETLAGLSGNIFAPPSFANAETGDYHLAAGSPCIDAGHPDPAYNDGDGSRCDMGAFGGTGYGPEYAWVTHVIATWKRLTGTEGLVTASASPF